MGHIACVQSSPLPLSIILVPTANHHHQFSVFVPEGAVKSNETQLYEDLFKNYNKYNHPTVKGADAVKVVFDFQLIRIIDVVGHFFSSFKVNEDLLLAWVDELEYNNE